MEDALDWSKGEDSFRECGSCLTQRLKELRDRSVAVALTYIPDFLERRLLSVEEQLRHFDQAPPISNDGANHNILSGGAHTARSSDDTGANLFEEREISHTTHQNTFSPPTASIQPHPKPFVSTYSHDLDLLSRPVVAELCQVWFHKYHRFFPILHQPSFTQLLGSTRSLPVSAHALVIQAIVATTLQHSQLLGGDAAQRIHWQDELAITVVIECIKQPTLQSIQALLILSMLQYGEGKSMHSWNFLAMARRMGTHLGLFNASHGDSTMGMSPTALRRLPTYTNTNVEDEEKIRAHWMIETLDSISTIGARFDVGHPNLSTIPVLPCSDSFWAQPEPVLTDSDMRPYSYCSAFSLCVILAVSELSNVHSFLRKSVAMDNFEERDAWQAEAQRVDERLTAWRDEFVAAVFRLINAEYTQHRRAEMDAHVVLTNCVLNTAVITLLQQRAACPEGIEAIAEPWAFASNRCVYACENTAYKVRQMDEDELLICHPHLIFSIFVAARFYIVHSKALDANVPTNLHSLAFALHVCGKRWPLARIYEQIIRVAVAEYRTPVSQSRVPKQFYNLRLTTFEVSDTLITWAEGPGTDISLSFDTQGDQAGAMNFTPMTIDVLA